MTMLALDEVFLIPIVAIAGTFVAGPIIVFTLAMRSVLIARAREQTKQELAAYVAEGTMKPETAVALARAGAEKNGDDDDSWI